jgi:hypothetical protein
MAKTIITANVEVFPNPTKDIAIEPGNDQSAHETGGWKGDANEK